MVLEREQRMRSNSKKEWINRIRKQRELLQTLKARDKITPQTYRQIYRKAKGGVFRSVRHIKLYLNEKELLK